MEHRHLLPDEFDLLVDGEEGFGVAPLTAHVRACPACATEIERRRRVVAELERLPHFTPTPLFAYHVMRDVQMFEPWYVPALDTARRLIPQSKPARVFAGATAGFVGVVLTLASVWVATRLDVAAFLLSIATLKVRGAMAGMAGGFLSSTLGESVAASVRQSGKPAVAIGVSTFLLTVIVAAFSLRAVATASRRRRS